MNKTATIDRYPGPRPFDESEKLLFFGRNLEIDELFQHINVHNLFVFHAESGLGKSSLINAGLIPKLKEKNFYPIIIRFKESKNESPVEHVLREIKKIILTNSSVQESGNDFNTIWYWIKQYNKEGLIPVLIFDQFEEFAYFKPDERKELANDLACLLVSSIPKYIKEKSIGTQEKTERFSWFSPPEVKLLFSLRSDRLNVFQEFSEPIPSILRNCYQLKPLTKGQAGKTIILPAVMESFGNIQFSSNPFNYTEGLLGDIMDVVEDNKTNTIETTHLQMICQEIELIVKKKGLGENEVVTQEDLKGKKGLEELVKNFYTKQLEKISQNSKISKEEYRAIRILIEKKLLIQQKRIPLAEDSVFQHFREHINRATAEGKEIKKVINDEKIKEIIDLLVSLRLIRDQTYGGSVFYEIGHDTLINPIIGEMLKTESLKEEAKKVARLRVYIISLFILSIGLIWATSTASKRYMQYKIERTNDWIDKQEYDSANSVLQTKNIFSRLDYRFNDEIEKLNDTIRKHDNLRHQLNSNLNSGDSLLSIADSQFENVNLFLEDFASKKKVSKLDIEKMSKEIGGEKLIEAWELYDKALNLNYKPKNEIDALELDSKLGPTNDRFPEFFGQCIGVTEFLLREKYNEEARIPYDMAKRLKLFASEKVITLDSTYLARYDTLTKKFSQ